MEMLGIIMGLGGLYFLTKKSKKSDNSTNYNKKLLGIIQHLTQQHNLTEMWNKNLRRQNQTTLDIGNDEIYISLTINSNAILYMSGERPLNLGVRYLPDVIKSLEIIKDGYDCPYTKQIIDNLINILQNYRGEYMYKKYKKHLNKNQPSS